MDIVPLIGLHAKSRSRGATFASTTALPDAWPRGRTVNEADPTKFPSALPSDTAVDAQRGDHVSVALPQGTLPSMGPVGTITVGDAKELLDVMPDDTPLCIQIAGTSGRFVAAHTIGVTSVHDDGQWFLEQDDGEIEAVVVT